VKFVEYKDLSKNRIRELDTHQVKIQDTWYHLPCAISAQLVITQDQHPIEINTACFEHLIAQQSADLLLIGRPASDIRFDLTWQKLLVSMNQQGIGLEQMTPDAAVRTFNVLMTEDRPFWLILV
jgi:uncharacterized protein